MKKIRVGLCFALVCMMIVSIIGKHTVYAINDTDKVPNLYAQYAAVVDADSCRVLLNKNGDKQVPMASTTKILTCILALEMGNIDDYVQISKEATKVPPVKMGVKEDETYRLKDLLYALMLESYNDTAVAIAIHIAGSIELFAKLMNEKAAEIGCHKYCFITPNGLDQTITEGSVLKEHSIAAIDLAKVMNYCCTKSRHKDEFIEITRTKSITINNINSKTIRNFPLYNHNQMLSNKMVISGKTGFTAKAGYCYVACVMVHNRAVSIVLQACGWPNNKNYKWRDMKTLLTFLDENTIEGEIDEEIELAPIKITGSQHHIGDEKNINKIPVYIQMKKYTMLHKKEEVLCRRIKIQKKIHTPIKKGQIVGAVIWSINGEKIYTVPIKATVSVKENCFVECFLECIIWYIFGV